MFKVYGVNAQGFDNPKMDVEIPNCDPTKETLETIRQKIAEAMLQIPNKVTLIKRGKDQDEKEEEEIPKENLHQTLSCALNEGDTLRFALETYGDVKINLKVEANAVKWIEDHSEDKEYHQFFAGDSENFDVTYKTNVLAMQIVILHFFFDSRHIHCTTQVIEPSLWRRRNGGDLQLRLKLLLATNLMEPTWPLNLLSMMEMI